jgi:putative acetyltransferase
MVSKADPEMRRATPADASSMAVAHVHSIRALGPAYYAPDIVDVWAAAVRPQMYLDAMRDGEVFFIAVGPIDGEPAVLGFASHRPGGAEDHVSVYIRGDCARRGLGTALLRLAEAHAVSMGATEITIEASLAGVAFYTANGFVEIRRDDARLQTGSVPCVVMHKRLAPSARPGVV